MIVLAKSVRGAEFMYNPKSAHRVSKASADKIAAALNNAGYQLQDGEIWYRHDIDQYTTAYDYASYQMFKVYKGAIRRYHA